MQKLSNVTRSIIALIDAELQRRTPNPVFDVVASPPSAGEGAAVHVYLYHAKECPHNKNLPAPGGAGPIPIQHTPLVLILQYMVTVVHAAGPQDPDSPYDEQDYIGYVARAIHDYPILTHETVLTDGTVLSDLDPRCELELILRPAPPEETISYYSAGQQNGLRLSLFVEARVALIDPEPPETTLPGMVMSIGTVVAPMNVPMLVSTRSSLHVLRQGVATLLPVMTPGRVAVFDRTSTVAPSLVNNNRLVIETSGPLGHELDLVIEGNGSRVRAPLTLPQYIDPQPRIELFEQGYKALTYTVLESLRGYVDDEQTTVGAFAVCPGLHSVSLLIKGLDGVKRPTNKVAFFVMPHVLSVAPSADEFVLTISGNYLLQIGRFPPEITLSWGGHGLVPRPATATTPEQIRYTYVLTESTIRFALPAVADRPRGLLPLQLQVNGVPALPYYWEAPTT
jgi:hypothetical protein